MWLDIHLICSFFSYFFRSILFAAFLFYSSMPIYSHSFGHINHKYRQWYEHELHVGHVIVLFQACRLHFFYIFFASMHIWEMSANWQNYKSILIDFLLQFYECAVLSWTKSMWLLHTLSHTRHELTLTEEKVNANRMTSTTLLLHQRNAEISDLMGIIYTSERCCHLINCSDSVYTSAWTICLKSKLKDEIESEWNKISLSSNTCKWRIFAILKYESRNLANCIPNTIRTVSMHNGKESNATIGQTDLIIPM